MNPTDSPATTTIATETPQTDPDEADHLATLVRARRFAAGTLALWTATVFLDVIASRSIAPGSLPRLLLLRGAGTGVILASWILIRSNVSPRVLRIILVASFTTMSVMVGLMGAIAGGLTTPYFGGAAAVLAAYAVVAHARWTRGAVNFAFVALGFPATMLGSALISPAIARQLADSRALAAFIFDVANLASIYVAAVLAGHVVWALRRQVFEARSLGRYKLKYRIGAGGMGEVWVAYHHGLKRDVAVKILRTEHVLDPKSAARRFEREVRATTELTHPNTVRILDYGVTDDSLWYYVMELLDGENLMELIEREGAQPSARALHLGTQAARALAEAHAKGIVHRDIKPQNLLITEAGGELDVMKVLDFGIAKVANESDEATLTRTGLVLGTPQWLAPEACAGKAVGPMADVYALGAVLHLLLAGKPPFTGDTFAALAYAHMNKPPPALPDTVPPDLKAIVARCLSKAPADRFANARELADALSSCKEAGTWLPSAPKTRVIAEGTDPESVDALANTEARG